MNVERLVNVLDIAVTLGKYLTEKFLKTLC